jgi:hypothetical protein
MKAEPDPDWAVCFVLKVARHARLVSRHGFAVLTPSIGTQPD